MSLSNNHLNDSSMKLLKIDEEMKRVTSYLNQLKNMKKQIEYSIINDLNNNNINGIKVYNHKIKIKHEHTYTPLSFSFLETNLKQLFSDTDVAKIINLIKSNRQKTSTPYLKIT
jgi:hypothetical protein